MKTARFAKVVQECGKPEIHPILTDPVEDKTLQKAAASNRVMTVYQDSQTDYGTIGLDIGKARQFLIFPKSLAHFSGLRVVGVKYELIAPVPLSKPKSDSKRQIPESAPEKTAAPVPNGERIPRIRIDDTTVPVAKVDTERSNDSVTEKAASDNLVDFPSPPPPEPVDQRIVTLKNQIRTALSLLEEGKHIQTYNLLKKVLDG